MSHCENERINKNISKANDSTVMNVFTGLRKFDAYSKPVEDFRERTITGAIITIACSIICLILFISEIRKRFLRNIFCTSGINHHIVLDSVNDSKTVKGIIWRRKLYPSYRLIIPEGQKCLLILTSP